MMIKKIVGAALSIFFLQTVNAQDVLVFATPDEHEANLFKETDKQISGELALDVTDFDKGVIEFDIPESFDLAYYRNSPAFLEFIPEDEEIENFSWTKMITIFRIPKSAKNLDEYFASFEKSMMSFDEKATVIKFATKSCKGMESRMLCIAMSNPYADRKEVTCARALQTEQDLWMTQFAFEIPEDTNVDAFLSTGSEYLRNHITYSVCK